MPAPAPHLRLALLVAFLLSLPLVAGCAARSASPADESTHEAAAEEPGDARIVLEVEGTLDPDHAPERASARWEREEISAPDTPAGRQLQWVLDTLEDEGAVRDLDEIGARFSPAFAEQVAPRQLVAIFRQLSEALGDFALTGFEFPPEPLRLVGVIRAEDGQHFRLIIAIEESDDTERMETLLFQPAPDLQPRRHTTWESLEEALQELAPQVQLLAAEVDAGACTPLHALDADAQRPISSTFKVWVLGALAERIAAGDMRWEDQLALRAEFTSTPTGTMQDEPPGTRHSLRHFAQQMIRISDNTATDHLMAHVGREQVEAWMASVGHSAPEANRPLLMTREAIAMKLAPGADLLAAWSAADEPGRRALLATDPVGFDLMEALGEDDWSAPRALDDVQWFASAHDLCRTFEALRARSVAGDDWEPVLEILGMNPGVPIDRERFPWVGFKGGSEPGTMSLNWLLLRADGRWFFLSLLAADPTSAIHEPGLLELAIAAIHLVSETP